MVATIIICATCGGRSPGNSAICDCGASLNAAEEQPSKQQMTFCQCGWQATVAVSMDITCPLCQRVFRVESKEDQGRAAWAALHSVVDPTPEWYAAWLETVPSFGCPCRHNWDALTKDNPPDYQNFAQWAIDRHNDVNRKLGKPIWHPTKNSDKPSM